MRRKTYTYYFVEKCARLDDFPKRNKILKICNFNEKMYMTEIDKEVYGYIEFKKPLTQEEKNKYKLFEENIKKYYVLKFDLEKDNFGTEHVINLFTNYFWTYRFEKPKDEIIEKNTVLTFSKYFESYEEQEKFKKEINSLMEKVMEQKFKETKDSFKQILEQTKGGNK